MKGTREVYTNPPAALVAIEVRHTSSAPLTTEQEGEIKTLIANAFPLSQPLQPTVVLSLGLPGSGQPVQQGPPRFTNRERTTAVTFGPQVILLETTKHETFAALNQLLALALGARQKVSPVDGLERLGLRYIDEIRVADPEPIDWSRWVRDSLVGLADVGVALSFTYTDHQALDRFQISDNQSLTIAYGPRRGHAVADAPLVRTLPPAGPFFLLDIDSSWTATGTVPEFDVTRITALCEELHEPVNALFEALITDRLREEVLRHA
jgi:uncharacterized protein (TIGR04255 family)